MTPLSRSRKATPKSRSRFVLPVLGVLVVGLAAWGGYAWLSAPPEPSPDGRGGEKPPTEQPPGPPWYQDVTAGSGLDFTHRNGEDANQFTILESLGGGVALIDYDGDGLLDVFVTGGGEFTGPKRQTITGRECKLYRNLGNFKFEDVTARAGLGGVKWWYNHGVAVADYDRDGWPDLLVTGYGKVALFHNEPARTGGGRVFVDVTESLGLRDTSWATSAGWGDIDGDGYPDLYVCHYCDWSFANNPACNGFAPGVPRDVCPPQRFKPLVHSLFKNHGGKLFREVSSDHSFQASGAGLGVVFADVNGDGRPDIYVANDGSNNHLYMNRGGRLEEKGLIAGVAVDDEGHYNGSMGTDAGDFDGTGRAALWVTNFQGDFHALYKNLGKEQFQHVSKKTGITALGQHMVGFGTCFLDADNDGWDDLVASHGHVLQHPILGSSHKQLPTLLRNIEQDGARSFKSLGATAGPFFTTPRIGRGVAIGDLDNDGWPDLVISHTNSPVVVLKNVVASHTPAKWIGFRLTGKGNRDIVGSTVTVETDGRTLTKFVKGGGSYMSASDPRLLFGLGATGAVKRVTVKWSWGETQTWDAPEPGAYWELREGESKAERR